MRKKLLTIVLLAAGLLCSTFSWAIEGDGTEGNPYQITSVADLTTACGGGYAKLMNNIEGVSSEQNIYAGNTLTLNLNGKTISGTSSIFAVRGALVVDDSEGGGLITTTGTYAIRARQAGCAITINAGKFVATSYPFYLYNTGTITMQNCTVEGGQQSLYLNAAVNVTVTNGYYKGVICNNQDKGNLTINGGYFTALPTGKYSTPDGWEIVQLPTPIGEYTYGLAAGTPTARIGSTDYTSFDKAYAAAQENDVIELLKDASTTLALSKNVKYTGDFTLTCTGIISAGVFDCAVTSGEGLLRGGSFKNEPVASDVYTTMYKVDYDGSYYNVVLNMDKMVASIGSTYYTSLQDAFTAMLNDETVTLLKDVVGEFVWQPNIYSDLTLTLDLNGNKIVSTSGTALRIYQQSSSSGTYNYTIKDTQGTGLIKGVDKAIHVDHNSQKKIYLTIKEGVNVEATAVDGYAIYSTSYQTSSYKHTITIEGGNFVGKLNKDIKEGYYYSLYVLQGGTYTYKADTSEIARKSNYATLSWPVSTYEDPQARGFVLLTTGYNYYQVGTSDKWEVLYGEPCNITVGESQHGTIAVKKKSGKDATTVGAGTTVYFINTPENGYKFVNYVVNGTAVSPSEGITTEYTVNSDITVTGNFVAKNPVYKNATTNVIYETLVEASEEVKEGETIEMLCDVTTNGESVKSTTNVNYIVDLKGYTLNLGDESLYIEGNVTIQNGTILSTDDYAIRTRQYVYPSMDAVESNLTLKNITMNGGLNMFMTDSYFYNCDLDASNKVHYAIYLEKTGSTATVYSGKYAGNNKALCAADGTNFVLYGGSYNSNPTASWVATGYTSEQIGSTGIYRVYKEEGKRPSVTLDKIGTICLPMDVEAGNYENATFYQIAYREGDVVYFDQVDDLKAGYAYIFSPSATGEITYKMSGAQTTTTTAFNGLYGTLEGINTGKAAGENALTGKYLVSNNIIQKCGNSCWLNANRAYIVWDEIPTTEPTQAPSRRISLSRNDVNTPTELENQFTDSPVHRFTKTIKDGKLIIVKDGKQFNAQGAAL